MSTPNRSVRPSYVDKADMSVTDLTSGGELVREQVMQFMAINVTASKFRERCRVVIMGRDTIEFPKMTTFGSQVWHTANEYQALPLAQRVTPGFSKTELTVREVAFTMKYPRHLLKVNVEMDRFQQTLMAYLGQHTRRDWEKLAIQGDSTASGFFGLFDGVVNGTTTYTYAAGGVALDESVLRSIRFTMPVQFRDQDNLAYFTSEEAQDAFIRSYGARLTPLGDSMETQGSPSPPYRGKPVFGIPLFPTSLGAGNNETVVLYMDTKNFLLGIRENMEIDTDYNIETRSYTVAGNAWITQGYLHEPLAVEGTGVLST